MKHVRSTGEVEIAMDHMRGALHGRGDTYLGDIVTMTHGGHRPVRGEQRIAYRRLCRRSHEREQLVPCPVRLLQCAFAREKVRQEFMETRIAARQVVRKVVGDLLDEQVVFRSVADE